MSILVLYPISKSVRAYCLSSGGGAEPNTDFGSGLKFPVPGHLENFSGSLMTDFPASIAH
jgi:hypothetical protein